MPRLVAEQVGNQLMNAAGRQSFSGCATRPPGSVLRLAGRCPEPKTRTKAPDDRNRTRSLLNGAVRRVRSVGGGACVVDANPHLGCLLRFVGAEQLLAESSVTSFPGAE